MKKMTKGYKDSNGTDMILHFLDCKLMLDMELTSLTTGNLTYYI